MYRRNRTHDAHMVIVAALLPIALTHRLWFVLSVRRLAPLQHVIVDNRSSSGGGSGGTGGDCNQPEELAQLLEL